MAHNKPLPETPSESSPKQLLGPTALSTDARLHRARLLRHIFDDIDEQGLRRKKYGWIYAFEEALDELGFAMDAGGWLSGLRLGRLSKDAARQSQLQRLGAAVNDESDSTAPNGTNDSHATPSLEDEMGNVEVKAPANLIQRVRQLTSLEGRHSTDTPLHMVLCVMPHSSRKPIPEEDSGFDIVPANIGCSFMRGSYTLDCDDGSNVLFGLQEWEEVESMRLVGGTFTFNGVTSPQQHRLLSRALRIAIYIQTSLILEQGLLKDLHVPLKYVRPKPIAPSSSTPSQPVTVGETKASPVKAWNSLLPTGILGLFSRKSLNRLARSNTIATDSSRGGSLDLDRSDELAKDNSLRPSFDSGLFRRFSILGGPAKPPSPTTAPPDTRLLFATALERVEKSRKCLSTSLGVLIEPPLLLIRLCEKEKQHPKRSLKGDEKVGLNSVLGWDGREDGGKGMSGITGFVRQQGICILSSEHTPPTEGSTLSSVKDSTLTTTPSNFSNLPQPGLKLCGKPHWVTYHFFAKDDRPMGLALREMIVNADIPCERSECRWKRGEHELRLIHAGIRIVVRINNLPKEVEEEVKGDGIESWQTCAACGSRTAKSSLSDAAWLFSFGKFLEVILYSPFIPTISPSLCEHTTGPNERRERLHETRFNIIRHFSTSEGTISFALSKIEDVFELRVPRLQIQRGREKLGRSTTDLSEASCDTQPTEDERKILRKEIRLWWESVSDHIDSLETLLDKSESSIRYKSLPRLPSSDADYDIFDGRGASLGEIPLPFSPSHTPVVEPEAGHFAERHPQASVSAADYSSTDDSQGSASTVTTSLVAPLIPPKDDSTLKLVALRHKLQRLEQSLYTELATTPVSSLNDVRRIFFFMAKGTEKRILAWQKKHLGSKASAAQEFCGKEPAWWEKGCHAVSGANIIINEEDWGSIIAFTLSTVDYQRELACLALNRPHSAKPSSSDVSSDIGAPSSFFSVTNGYKFFSSATQPDPDHDDDAWNQPEPCSAVISRKEHIRDPTSILSIRDVLRKGAAVPADSVSVRAGTGGPAARAKADVGLNVRPAGGQVISFTENETVEKLLHDLEHLPTESQPSSRPPSVLGLATSSWTPPKLNKNIDHVKASVDSLSAASTQSEDTIGKEAGVPAASTESNLSVATSPPTVPNKGPPAVPSKDDAPPIPAKSDVPPAASSSFASTIASSLGTAVRYVMSSNDLLPRTPSLPPKHHTLLGADFEAIDDRPHIKYDWTIGKRLKFSCTVYYAKQFDLLRKRLGIDDIFVKSLSKSRNWAADGGKSKSNFWKTNDERFIIKTLVNAWNVADLQFLIDLAPSYFRYMDSTMNKATALAKLLGFYTIEIRNLETGALQSKVDLLVMENLFYDQHISKTFDLKGIQGRKVNATNKGGGTTKTLFDGEWIEDQQRTLMLIHPHSKRVLKEAIRSDAEFLAKSNIMDYSLLLGIDEKKKQIACGLVDTIGSYTFAKTLEYKAKHGLQSGTGKEVTVIPPADYQERFVHALEGYFVACPDKWSKPVDESDIISDPDLLPSVL